MNQAANNITLTASANPALINPSMHDFDFLAGSWAVRNRRLRERLSGSNEWDEFDATSTARIMLGGIANEDEFHTGHAGGFIGMSFRFFNPVTQQWSIYWADSRTGELQAPVVGGFQGEIGIFSGADTLKGKAILVRYTWSGVSGQTPRWEQAFSADGGLHWETNWIMEFTRVAAAR